MGPRTTMSSHWRGENSAPLSLADGEGFPESFLTIMLVHSTNIFFSVYLFLTESETEHEGGRARARETQNPKQGPGSELSAQSPMQASNPQTVRS